MANKIYFANALTGGLNGALDRIDGDDVLDLDAAIAVLATKVYCFSLDEDSALDEDIPNVIKPDLNANNKRWILTDFYSNDAYVWIKAALIDQVGEQILTTGTGELSLANLDSGQLSLPTFTGNVEVTIGSPYQDRQAYISTAASISVGNVTFGVTLSSAGVEGTPYFNISVRQL